MTYFFYLLFYCKMKKYKANKKMFYKIKLYSKENSFKIVQEFHKQIQRKNNTLAAGYALIETHCYA